MQMDRHPAGTFRKSPLKAAGVLLPRAMIRERVMAGIARGRAEGKTMGRRRVEDSHPEKIKAARAMRARGMGMRKIATVGLGVGTVMRLVAAAP
jgi:hypothetical protein